MNIKLHIERLILDSALGAADAAQVQAEVAAQLAQLLAKNGLSPALVAGGAIASLRAGPAVPAGPAGPALGQQIGAAVYSSIGNQE